MLVGESKVKSSEEKNSNQVSAAYNTYGKFIFLFLYHTIFLQVYYKQIFFYPERNKLIYLLF